MKHTTKVENDKHTSHLHEAQLAAALLEPTYAPTIMTAMGSFGPALFSSTHAQFIFNCVSQGQTDAIQIIERIDAPEGLQKYLLTSLDLLHAKQQQGATAQTFVPVVNILAGLARQRLVFEAVQKGLTPGEVQDVILKLPTTAPAEEHTFCDLLQRRFLHLVESIGIPQKHVLKTTWGRMNNMLQGGFRDGELIVLAARPGMGKTAFALCLAIAMSFQRPVDFYSCEMGQAEILDRCLAILAGIPGSDILTPSERLKRYTQAVNHIDDSMNLRLEDRGNLTLNEMLHRSRGRVPVIDYLQLVPGLNRGSKFENRQLEVAAMSKACKEWARTNKSPVIVLSQLNRDVEKRKDKRPLPSDLRESGAVEQDADKILFLYRDAVYNGEDTDKQKPHEAELIIAKQRNGPTGTCFLTFEPEQGRFIET